jgi:exocyst complex component 3
LRVEAARYLLEEAFLDLELHFQDIVTVNWMGSSLAVDTICITLDDYYNDYRHLRPDNFELVVNEGMNTVAKKYITAMLQKKMTFKNGDDRKSGAIKIKNEGNKLKSFFERIASDVASINFSLDAICSLAEVLKNDDTDMLSLDIAALVKDYPDVSQEHLIQLLGLRGDVSKSDSREIAADALKNPKNTKTIFSMVTGITVGFF